jgi:hypothetical protein
MRLNSGRARSQSSRACAVMMRLASSLRRSELSCPGRYRRDRNVANRQRRPVSRVGTLSRRSTTGRTVDPATPRYHRPCGLHNLAKRDVLRRSCGSSSGRDDPVLAQLITVAALGVFVTRCLQLLIRTATTSHRAQYVVSVKRYVSTLGAQTRRTVARLHKLIAEQIHVLVLAGNRLLSRRTPTSGYDLRSWWPWWWRGYQPAETVDPGSCGTLNNSASANSVGAEP